MVQKTPLFSWIFKRHRGLQLTILGLILLAVFFRVFPLEMQKRIVNEAIRFNKLQLLFIYCGLYLGAVLLAGSLKYLINVLQGFISQKILLEMRSQLYQHILRLPIPFFRKTAPGMVITFLTSELSAVGDFLGSALTLPTINILTLLTFAAYMFYLNPLLAFLSLSIYPIEVVIIPMLQKRINRLNQERIEVTRSLSNTIGEAISGIHEIHGNSSYPLENQKFGGFARSLFSIRHRMNIFRYGVKFTNNFFQSLGPFTLFLVGGYLAIQGRLDLGALVAFLSAYEKLYDPWKELMDYYQDFQDSRVRYERVMSYFDAKPEFEIAPLEREPLALRGNYEVSGLRYVVEDRIRLLDQISMAIAPGEQIALVGFSGSGKSTLAMVLGQLYNYHAGRVLVDGQELKTLTKLDVSQNIGYVPQDPFIFDGTIRDNLLYACQSLNLSKPHANKRLLPAKEEVLELVNLVGFADDVLRFGMDSVIERNSNRDLVPRLIKVRQLFYQKWGEDLARVIEFLDPHRYFYQGSVLVNIVFGYPTQDPKLLERLPSNRRFREFLEETGLAAGLIELGVHLARNAVSLLRDLRGDAFFFEASPIPEEQFDQYSDLVERMDIPADTQPSAEDQALLLSLALRFVPARHKMFALASELREKILHARREFAERCHRDTFPAFSFYRKSDYLFTYSLLDNILFGRLRSGQAQAVEQVRQRVVELLEQEDLLADVMNLGLEFPVGSKGDRLSGGQKQKIAIIRALLKQPTILILDEATSSLDNASQARIEHLLQTRYRGRCTVIAVAHRLDTIAAFDQIAVMKAGKIIEMGNHEELMARRGAFYELAQGTRETM